MCVHIEKDLEKYTLRLGAIKSWVLWKQIRTPNLASKVLIKDLYVYKKEGARALCKKEADLQGSVSLVSPNLIYGFLKVFHDALKRPEF